MSLTPLTYVLLFVANVAPTFDKRFNESEALTQKSPLTKEDKERACELLKAILRDARIEDERLYAKRRLAWWEFRLGSRDEARKILEEALRKAPADSYLTFQINYDLGEYYLEAVQQDRAEKCIKRALELARKNELLWMKEKQVPVPEVMTTRLEIRLAELKGFQNGELAAAHKEFSDLRRGIEDKVTDVHWAVLVARCDLNLADVERRQGRPFDALRRLKKCVAYLQPFNNYEAFEMRYSCHHSLAVIYTPLTRFKDARDETAAAADLLKLLNNARTAGDLENLRAVVALEECGFRFANNPEDSVLLERLKEAETHAKAALDRYGSAASNSVAHTTLTLGQIRALHARALAQSGGSPEKVRAQYQQARESMTEALRRFRETLPEDNDLVLLCRRLLAGVALKLDEVSDARKQAEDTVALFRKVHPREEDELMGRGLLLQQLLEIEEQAGNLKQAASYARDHRHLAAERLVTFLAGLTAAEQIKFFRTWDDPGLHGSLRLGIGSADFAADSAEWLINGKAKSAEVLGEVIRQQRLQKDFPQLQKAIARQAYLLYRARQDDPAVQTKLQEVEALKRELAAQRPVRPSQKWYELEKLRERLTNDDVYIDVFCLRPKASAPRAYFAWVVKAKGPVAVVPLGEADKIEPLVEAFQQHMKECAGSDGFPSGVPRAERTLRKNCLGPLSELILKDLLPVVKDKPHWIVSPDGPLWNVSWGALVLPADGPYLIEKYTFRYVVSGRDLAQPAAPAVPVGDPWIVANPDYDWKPRGINGRVEFGLSQLAGAEQEGREVMACLKPFFKAKPRILIGEEGTKAAFLELARPPRIVYLTTHGISSLAQDFFKVPLTRSGDDVFLVDPLVSCGLALAGFNFIPNGKGPGGETLPGLLTGAEVLAVDLQGTELVVLSACQTGTGKKGKMSFGQSPADLRHAFHLAGAQNVVSSLWSVDDNATRELMVSFMGAFARRPAADKAELLAGAQRDLIARRRRDRDHESHPFFWAAFTLSGR
jgi:CHAT domain-containing protein/tetratricopeptide (TPR) repeat protein